MRQELNTLKIRLFDAQEELAQSKENLSVICKLAIEATGVKAETVGDLATALKDIADKASAPVKPKAKPKKEPKTEK